MKQIKLNFTARLLTGLFLFIAAFAQGSTLSSKSLTLPSSSEIYGKLAPVQTVTAKVVPVTKTIIVGYYDGNQTKNTGASIGGANCSAFATRHKIKITATGELLGVPFINDCKQSSPVTGEGGQTDTIEVQACLIYKGVKYLLYQDVDAGDRVATLGAGLRTTLWLKGAIPVVKGDYVYVQTSWDGATAAINFPRHAPIHLNEDEGYLFFTDADPAVNETASRTAADVHEWLPVVGNQKKFDQTAQTTRLPAPAGLMLRVLNETPHVAIWGTSRSIGTKNAYSDPTLYNDSFIAAACDAEQISWVLNSVGASQGLTDYDDPQYTANRVWLSQGATIVIDEHHQNDIGDSQSIREMQRRWRDRYLHKPPGSTYVICTIDPWTTTSVSGDWTLNSTQTAVTTGGHNVKRPKINAWFRGARNGTCADGNPNIKLYMICDRVIDSSSVVEYASNKALWKDATVADTGTATSTSATTLVASAETWTAYAYPDRYVVTLTAADAITKGIVTTNAPVAPGTLANTSTTLTVASWSNGTAGNKAFTIYNTVTNDGLHASFYGNRLKEEKVKAFLPGTTQTFNGLTSVPWDEFWIADKSSLYQDTACSVNVAAASDPVQVWVGSINGLKFTGATTTRPLFNPTAANRGAMLFDGTDDELNTTSAPMITWTRKQHRMMFLSVFECPDSSAAARTVAFFANNAGSTRLNLLFKTGGAAGTGIPQSNSRIDEAGTQNADDWPTTYTAGDLIVRIDYVDYQEGQQKGWINGSIQLNDATAWAASAGLSVDTSSTVVYIGRSNSGAYFNARLLGIGVVNNYEPTPATIASLSSWFATLSNWTASTAEDEVQGSLIAEINKIGAKADRLVGARR